MWFFCTFIFFSFGNLMKQSSDDELKVNILGGHGLQTCDQVIKRWGRLMRNTMYTSWSSIFTSMECNWFVSAFTMLMCVNKFSPFCIFMVKSLLRKNNLFLIVSTLWASQSVSQMLLTFSQYWMCASCASMRGSQSNANALVAFSL